MRWSKISHAKFKSLGFFSITLQDIGHHIIQGMAGTAAAPPHSTF